MKRGLFILCAPLVLAAAAQAQTRYVCRNADGGYYRSASPCTESGVVYYGPSETRPTYTPPPPKVGEAPPHIEYMSARCSALHDAIRTGPARGLTYETLADMRKTYQRECGEEEMEAYAKLSREKREQRKQRREEQVAGEKAQDQAKMQDERCGEAKRILYNKRKRTDLTEGEKADLRRFEENYHARCG